MKSPFISTVRPRGVAGLVVAFALAALAAHAAPAVNTPSANTPAATNAPAATAPTGAKADIDKDSGKPIVTTPSGLKYVDLIPGTGIQVKLGDHVTVKYVGKLMNGTVFDASANHGGTMDYVQGLTNLIPGWTEGTSTMKVGGKRKLIIPPQLAYGLEGRGDVIPPNATLIFEIDLVAINNPQ